MDIDDKELFSSANADDQIPEAAPETPAEKPAAEPQQDGPARDEHGRFAPKQAEPASQERAATPPPEPETAEQQLARDDGGIPAWRLREMREERNAERQRSFELQRQLEMLQRQMPKPEPPPKPDWYENPDAAAEYGARQLVTPLEQRIIAMEKRAQEEREFHSRNYAFQQYGEQEVRSAYDWMAQGIGAGDPEVQQAYTRAMQSLHPYDAMVKAFKQVSLVQQVEAAGGPDKWREQQLAAGQPQQQVRQSNGQPQGSITKLPPSLRNTPSARSGNDDDSSDMSDAALFRHASR